MEINTQLEIFYLQSAIKRHYDTQTQEFTRYADEFESCTQLISYDVATGAVVGTSPTKIVPIPLDPSKAKTPELAALVSQIRDLVGQLQPLVAEATILQVQDSISQPENMASA